MDVRQLRYFVGVLEAKSLSKASVLLHVAQPALGVQIGNLERELGAKLLHRHSRGVAPTDVGERLARRARHLLKEFDDLRRNLIDCADFSERSRAALRESEYTSHCHGHDCGALPKYVS